MNISNPGDNSSRAVVRDDLNTAILKNVITVTLCISINYINATLVYIFLKHEIFKMNPRYILYIHLVINDIILLTMLTIIQVLSYIFYSLNVSLCIVLLLIALSANINTPMTLAIMAIECYVAVCFPLRYSQICTVKRTFIVIGIIWLISGQFVLPDLFFSMATKPLDFFHSRQFCMKPIIFQNTYLDQKDIIVNAVLLVLVWLTLFYTYFKILLTAKTAAADAKKAKNTVLLHSFQLMLSMLTYVDYTLLSALTYLFPKSAHTVRFAVAIIVNVMPRLISPLVYGIRDKTFRKYLIVYLLCKKKQIRCRG